MRRQYTGLRDGSPAGPSAVRATSVGLHVTTEELNGIASCDPGDRALACCPMPSRVRITDVSPRDGLQNEQGIVPAPDKVRLVRALCISGVDEIEVSSFVSPKWVPQLADAPEVLEAVAHISPRPLISALVPNVHGMDAALRVNDRAYADTGRIVIDKIAIFTAASESFSKKNTNATIAESIERFRPVVALARKNTLVVRAYVSCVIACPFEGPTQPESVARVVSMLASLGVDEIDLGDTIGAGEPHTVRAMLQAAMAAPGTQNPELIWTLHLHDTYGRAASCVRAALEVGIRSFDGAAGGLGGCPYAGTPQRRAPGNISTETLIRTIHDAGYETSVNPDAIAAAGRLARDIVSAHPPGVAR